MTHTANSNLAFYNSQALEFSLKGENMPYKLMKKGSKTCVAKEDGTIIPGGCHANSADAKRHMRALYANVPDAKSYFVDRWVELERLLGVQLEVKGDLYKPGQRPEDLAKKAEPLSRQGAYGGRYS